MASALQLALPVSRLPVPVPAAFSPPSLSFHSSPRFNAKGLPLLQKSNRSRLSITAPSAVVKATAGGKVKEGRVVVEPSFAIPAVLVAGAGILYVADNVLLAAPVGLLGAFLAVQATRVRFLFDEDSLEVVIGEKAEKSGENAFVGGENRWRYSTFTNWEFWWPNFPVLVYFKETQTKPEGQIHFFPVIADGQQLYKLMVERCGESKTSSPSEK